MMVLADIGLAQLIWTMIFLFIVAAAAWVFILIVKDLFSARDLSGWAKAGWLVVLVLVPLLGSLIYVIVRGLLLDVIVGSADDAAARAQISRTEFERRDRAGGGSTAGGIPGDPT